MMDEKCGSFQGASDISSFHPSSSSSAPARFSTYVLTYLLPLIYVGTTFHA